MHYVLAFIQYLTKPILCLETKLHAYFIFWGARALTMCSLLFLIPESRNGFTGKLATLKKVALACSTSHAEFFFLLGTHSVQWVIRVLTSLQTGSFTHQHLSLK
jgi:hypothetical protein